MKDARTYRELGRFLLGSSVRLLKGLSKNALRKTKDAHATRRVPEPDGWLATQLHPRP